MMHSALLVLLMLGDPDPTTGASPAVPAAPSATPSEEKRIAPQAAVLALRQWHDAALCSSCKGIGKITKTVTTGTTNGAPNPAGPTIKQPVTKDVLVDCPTCDGDKLTKEKRLVATASAFAKALKQVDIEDGRWPAAHDDMVTKLRELCDLGMKAWEKRLNKNIVVTLTGTAMKSGQPIVFVGGLNREKQKNEIDDRILWVNVGNTRVRFEKPRLVDTSGSGMYAPLSVLCGGWLVKREDANGQFESVVEDGFIVSGK